MQKVVQITECTVLRKAEEKTIQTNKWKQT